MVYPRGTWQLVQTSCTFPTALDLPAVASKGLVSTLSFRKPRSGTHMQMSTNINLATPTDRCWAVCNFITPSTCTANAHETACTGHQNNRTGSSQHKQCAKQNCPCAMDVAHMAINCSGVFLLTVLVFFRLKETIRMNNTLNITIRRVSRLKVVKF